MAEQVAVTGFVDIESDLKQLCRCGLASSHSLLPASSSQVD